MSDGRAGGEADILHVPVAVCSPSVVAIRTALLASGERVGLGFTSEAGLIAVFGRGQAWILIHLRPLREMLRPHGISRVQVDPLGCRPAPGRARPPARAHPGRPLRRPPAEPATLAALSVPEIHSVAGNT